MPSLVKKLSKNEHVKIKYNLKNVSHKNFKKTRVIKQKYNNKKGRNNQVSKKLLCLSKSKEK